MFQNSFDNIMDAFIVLVKLLCAHLCADFIFQTDSINKGKRKSGGKGVAYNLLHSLVQIIPSSKTLTLPRSG